MVSWKWTLCLISCVAIFHLSYSPGHARERAQVSDSRMHGPGSREQQPQHTSQVSRIAGCSTRTHNHAHTNTHAIHTLKLVILDVVPIVETHKLINSQTHCKRLSLSLSLSLSLTASLSPSPSPLSLSLSGCPIAAASKLNKTHEKPVLSQASPSEASTTANSDRVLR